ncbi:MAG: DUF5666 domain-containing protein [Nostocoides sp.]
MITTPRPYAVLALAAAATLSLAACGGSGTANPSSTAAAANSSAAGNGGGGQRQGGFAARTPGVNGLIAAVDGSTLQVQTRTDQTAVTWSAATKFTAQVRVSSSTLKVGDCVIARPDVPAGAGGAGGGATAASTRIAAATVQIISTGSTGCSFGTGRAAGGASGAPTGRPSGGPTGNGTRTGGAGGFGGRGAAGSGAIGEVASIGSGTFTVTEAGFAARFDGSASASAPPTTAVPRTVTVTYAATTAFTTTKAATSSAIKVGECVAAQGKADDTGSVAATAMALSPATAGHCTGGFGRA